MAADRSSMLFGLQRRLREEEDCGRALEERNQKLQSLQQRVDGLQKDHQKTQDFQFGLDMFLKDEDAARVVEKAERERKEVLQKSKEIERLKKKKAELIEFSQQLQLELQSHIQYREIMEQMMKLTKFKDVELLTDHVEGLLHLKDQLSEREREAQEQVDRKKKELVTLNDQHQLLHLQKNNELSQLQTELDDTRSEALLWERKWNHIQETAAKKTLQLGQIKMATLNLYELTGATVEEEEGVDMNDTDNQLGKVKTFIQDYGNIVKQYQTPSQMYNDGQKSDKKKQARHNLL
ncbi:coiled-coil domain-containing protein 42 homolog [Trachinotus anak]|uniref:coiled-coil domain-containing protein 42 homolog n=1 Tax=Trachinotus anak TaxID=443729 RepID=UPI0039F1B5AE